MLCRVLNNAKRFTHIEDCVSNIFKYGEILLSLEKQIADVMVTDLNGIAKFKP